MFSVFSSPARYTQGLDATAILGAEMAGLGIEGPALIVAGGSALAQLSGTWRQTLGEVGCSYGIHRFGGECSLAEILRIRHAAEALPARVVIGAGGGKALDAARASAAELGLPFVSCPTLASTDAPCSAVSVVYGESGAVEEVRILPRNPVLVLVDTRVIVQAPPRLLISGMGDALATWFEARACAASGARNLRGGRSTRSALALAELCYRTLLEDGVEAVEAAGTQTVTPAFERIVEANTLLSGLGFESSGLAAAHSVHNGLTAAPQTRAFTHGEKVAFGTLVQLVLEKSDRSAIDEVMGFCAQVGLPVTLAQIGLRELSGEMLERIALRATRTGESIHNEPFEVSANRVADAILKADALGRALPGNGKLPSPE
ncbi:glycerol dehydrogenase [Syntrophobacter fumaroxidans]|uniref:Glycerol dehydrogenase n=1 Tax=Syntrophobacter fumaroxidans (strain DSM 10017 / MPOB) TaxID=335543 RepID=A0LFL7_SYNFM|nr:glycerol dehydrogenase [Syntrophobacter fumaroxidans]ABK16219.1 iron-containing alcohol dehydrogenase [Syntrophobacter fumaroxidans MPOB]